MKAGLELSIFDVLETFKICANHGGSSWTTKNGGQNADNAPDTERTINLASQGLYIPSRATAKTLVQAGHVTPPNRPKSGRFLISVLYAIKGGVAKYNMSLSCMSEPLEMPKRNK